MSKVPDEMWKTAMSEVLAKLPRLKTLSHLQHVNVLRPILDNTPVMCNLTTYIYDQFSMHSSLPLVALFDDGVVTAHDLEDAHSERNFASYAKTLEFMPGAQPIKKMLLLARRVE